MSKYNELFITTTDTVPGIGAPVSKENRALIMELKKRDPSKPIIIMVGSIEQARSFNEWNDKAEELAKTYWPGATTLVVSDELALRIPDCKELQDLLIKIGPSYMTSSNIAGQKQLSFEESINKFTMIKKHYNFCSGTSQPSTIIDIRNGKVLR